MLQCKAYCCLFKFTHRDFKSGVNKTVCCSMIKLLFIKMTKMLLGCSLDVRHDEYWCQWNVYACERPTSFPDHCWCSSVWKVVRFKNNTGMAVKNCDYVRCHNPTNRALLWSGQKVIQFSLYRRLTALRLVHANNTAMSTLVDNEIYR